MIAITITEQVYAHQISQHTGQGALSSMSITSQSILSKRSTRAKTVETRITDHLSMTHIMPVRFLLKFITPFKVGDIVYLAYPPNRKVVTGSVKEIRPLKVTICAIRISFGLTEDLTLKERVDSCEMKVEHVIYTLVPFPPHQFSPFTVSCSERDLTPILYNTEEEFARQEAT